jgi:hypothetical protein
MTKRSYDIDWLRILATGMVFLFHCARFFDEGGWHVKNNVTAFGASVFVAVVGQWIMPLFFLLSGLSTYYALTFRGNGQFVGERFRRLVIPFLEIRQRSGAAILHPAPDGHRGDRLLHRKLGHTRVDEVSYPGRERFRHHHGRVRRPDSTKQRIAVSVWDESHGEDCRSRAADGQRMKL